MITRAINNCLRLSTEKHWEKTYWAFDIHGTILKPNYKANKIATEFYPYAVEALQLIAKLPGVITILHTCSYPHEIIQYLDLFKENGIHFDYVNKNPEVNNGGYGYYAEKFYFNVLFEDKAGFDGNTDWKAVVDLLRKT